MPDERPRRTTGEILVLGIAATVCVLVLMVTGAVIVIEILEPSVDTSGPASAISGVISTLVGLVAGFLAGRTDTRRNGRDP
jgi:hypothetical protein